MKVAIHCQIQMSLKDNKNNMKYRYGYHINCQTLTIIEHLMPHPAMTSVTTGRLAAGFTLGMN